MIFFFTCNNYSKQLEIYIWEINKREYHKIFIEYPNFQPILELRMRQANSIWASAAKETNHNTQVKKMQMANQNIHSLLGYFTQIQNKIDILKKSIFKLSSYKNLEYEIAKNLNQIQKEVLELEFNLKETQFYDENNLKTFLVKFIQKLEDEQEKVDEIFKKTKL